MSTGSDEQYPPDPDEPDVPTPHAGQVRKRVIQKRGQIKVSKKVKNATSPNRLLKKEKERKALELRKGGANFHQIAQAVGYADASGAYRAVKRAMKEITQEPAIELKTMQIERLNHMLLTLWPKVQQGDESSINTALRVMDKIDALMGTEAASQVDINVNHKDSILVIDGNKDDYIAAMKRMVGVDASGRNLPQIGQAPHTMHVGQDDNSDEVVLDVIDAEVVEDKQQEAVHVVDEPPMPTKKQFRFGVDPTVKRKQEEQ